MDSSRSNVALRLLEFEAVLSEIASKTVSRYGRERVMSLEPFVEDPLLLYKRSSEFENIMRIQGEPPFSVFHDLYVYIDKVNLGYSLIGEELNRCATTMENTCRLKEFFEPLVDSSPNVASLASQLSCERGFIAEVRKKISEEGLVKDQASPELREIRNELRGLTRNLRNRLDSIMSRYKDGLTDTLVLSRDGRYVLPLSSGKKNEYQGIIHGSSSSGATVYFEPQELISLNDTLKILQSREEEEIRRILRELTFLFQGTFERLGPSLEALGVLDSLYGICRYARKRKGVFIEPSNDRTFVLREARHPLIEDDKVVPITFHMRDGINGVFITGPNTGGKTVAMKTIGLSVVLMLCGLPVLADQTSSIPYFKNIYADIGDEQSIEQSLSTFSSHISRIIGIIKNTDTDSLVLLDELGAGTDPVEGAALSIAIIEKLLSTDCRLILTTHLTPIKLYAMEREDVENASVEFDVNTLRPTYRLLMGIPGSSNAIEVSKRLGLPLEIIDKAQRYMDSDARDLEVVIGKLHKERSTLENERRTLESTKRELESRTREYEDKLSLIKEKRYREVSEEMASLEERLGRILKEIENSINLSRSERERDKVSAVKKLHDLKIQVEKHRYFAVNKNEEIPEVGDTVRLLDGGTEGKVSALDGDRVIVDSGKVTIKVPVSKIRVIGKVDRTVDEISFEVQTPITSSEIDIRGNYTEDVPILVSDFIHSLKRNGLKQGYIIHGKGTGKLAESVWNYLRRTKGVKNFRIGTAREGGSGVTVVEV
jgi:DNA mismatch repair protein MutS2